MKPLKAKVSITLDHDLVSKIRHLAEEDDRSFSQYINLVLKDWVKKKRMIMAKSNALQTSYGNFLFIVKFST